MKNFEDDYNYNILRDIYAKLEFEFDEETAPPEVYCLVDQIRDLLDDACAIYESGEDEAND